MGLRIFALIHGCALTEIREFKFDLLKILSLGFFFKIISRFVFLMFLFKTHLDLNSYDF